MLTEVGRHGAITPALATLGLGVVPLLDLASDEQQDRFLAGVAKGGVLTAALNEPGTALPDRPATTFADGRLSGTKVGVAYAEQADWLIVTADNAVVLVSPKTDGVRVVRTPTSNGSDEYTVDFRRRRDSGHRCVGRRRRRTASMSWRWRRSAPSPMGWWPGRCG